MLKDFDKRVADYNAKFTIKDYVDEMPCGLEEERRKKVEVFISTEMLKWHMPRTTNLMSFSIEIRSGSSRSMDFLRMEYSLYVVIISRLEYDNNNSLPGNRWGNNKQKR